VARRSLAAADNSPSPAEPAGPWGLPAGSNGGGGGGGEGGLGRRRGGAAAAAQRHRRCARRGGGRGWRRSCGKGVRGVNWTGCFGKKRGRQKRGRQWPGEGSGGSVQTKYRYCLRSMEITGDHGRCECGDHGPWSDISGDIRPAEGAPRGPGPALSRCMKRSKGLQAAGLGSRIAGPG
jgi:hypothetical protein